MILTISAQVKVIHILGLLYETMAEKNNHYITIQLGHKTV